MKLDVLLSFGAQFELHLRIDVAMRRLDCHVFHGPSVKSVVFAVIPGGSYWERVLLRNVLALLTCVETFSGLSAISVTDNVRLGRANAAVTRPVVPLVMRRFDAEWLTDPHVIHSEPGID